MKFKIIKRLKSDYNNKSRTYIEYDLLEENLEARWGPWTTVATGFSKFEDAEHFAKEYAMVSSEKIFEV